MLAKLSLNKKSLALVANLTGLGVPLKTSVLLINNPVIRQLYYEAINKDKPTDPGILKLTKNALDTINQQLGEDQERLEVTDTLLSEQIANGNVTDENKSYLLATRSILEQFKTALQVTEYTGKVSSIMNLSSSIGRNINDVKSKIKDISDLGLNLNNEDQ